MGWPRSITTWSHGGYNIAEKCQELGIPYPARTGSLDAWNLQMVRLLDREPRVKELCDQDYEAAVARGPSEAA